MRSLHLPLLISAALILGACGDDGTGPNGGHPADGLRFTFAGEHSGNFEAVGVPSIDSAGNVPFSQFAAAIETDSFMAVVAFQPRTGTTGDMFMLMLGRLTAPGTVYTNPIACGTGSLSTCVIGGFARNVSLDDFEELFEDENVFIYHSGAIEILQLDSLRLVGTFSGTAAEALDANKTLQLTGGSFNLPVLGQDLIMR